MKSQYFLDEIEKVEENIKNKFPYARDIKINLIKDNKGEFKTVIKVRVPRKKEYMAIKSDHDPRASLEKSLSAIVKQIVRTKRHWRRVRSKALKNLQAA